MLFAHEERSMENIPPTFKTLKQHVMLFFPLIKKILFARLNRKLLVVFLLHSFFGRSSK